MMNFIIKRIADNTKSGSWAVRMRQKRFDFFSSLLQNTPKPVKLLDIGGSQIFWETMGFTDVPDVHITLLNLHKQEVKYQNFSSLTGDTTNLSAIKDDQFDVVFSNSVIEHVGNFNQQKRMAEEVRRVGKRYFVQTPNYFFPIEPHFLFFGFHWLPISTRTFLINHFDLGWMKRVPDVNEARNVVENIRLLRKKEFLSLFPEAELYEEKFFGLTKSFIAYKV